MRIRIATKAWSGGAAAEAENLEVGIKIPWVEIDGERTDSVVNAIVESGQGLTRVTLVFLAAVEMVLIDRDGQIIPQPEELP